MARDLSPLYAGIKHFEAGGRPYKPKWDYKLYTWGYGTPYKKGMEMSPEIAEREMQAHVARKQAEILRRFPELAKPENFNRLMALTDLTYNAGSKWFNAGLGKSVARGDWNDASRRFVQYNKAGGKTLPGLAKRRLWGVALMNDKVQDPTGFGGAATTVRAGGGGSYLDGSPERTALADAVAKPAPGMETGPEGVINVTAPGTYRSAQEVGMPKVQQFATGPELIEALPSGAAGPAGAIGTAGPAQMPPLPTKAPPSLSFSQRMGEYWSHPVPGGPAPWDLADALTRK